MWCGLAGFLPKGAFLGMKARSLSLGDSGVQTWDSKNCQSSPGRRMTVRDLLAPQGPHSPAELWGLSR